MDRPVIGLGAAREESQLQTASETAGCISAGGLRRSSPRGQPIRAPELSELETLVVCATEGSLAGAAARLGISRPAVTKRIANLEALTDRALLHRGGRGVSLTDAGAALTAGARRMLDERDQLTGTIADIRGDGPSQIAGLRELLGHSTAASRAAQLPETRLNETERILELILRASATGVAISDPDTRAFHEVNDAYCRILGRSRDELLGRSSTEAGIWHDEAEADRLRNTVEQTGGLERVVVRVQRPDGTVRVVETTVHRVTLGGKRQLVSTVDDITEQSLAQVDRDVSDSGYRALARAAAFLLADRPVLDCVGAVLFELRRNSGFALAVLWDLEYDRPHSFDGREPPAGLGERLRDAVATSGERVVRLQYQLPGEEQAGGLAVVLPSTRCVLALLSAEPHSLSALELFETLLTDLTALISARTEPNAPVRGGPQSARDSAESRR